MGEWRQIAGSSEITLESHPALLENCLMQWKKNIPVANGVLLW